MVPHLVQAAAGELRSRAPREVDGIRLVAGLHMGQHSLHKAAYQAEGLPRDSFCRMEGSTFALRR
eukprot:scaffold28130_cov55-Prasinocladus_malaysianus.AAC.1